MKILGGKVINKIASSLKSIIPILKRHMSMGEKRETSFNYMTMFALNGTLLLVSIGTRNTMDNTTICKEGGDGAIFATPISLNRFNGSVKKSLNIFLKFEKNILGITLFCHRV